MNFIKLFCAGKDYIFFSEDNGFERIGKTDIKRLCDRFKGVGADGIFAINKTDLKNSLISGFSQNGEIMRDFSTASICANFELFLKRSIRNHEFLCPNGEIIRIENDFSNEKSSISCTVKTTPEDSIFNKVCRKTEIGNRILTITPIALHGIHAVHFSECRERLDIDYLGRHLSYNSLFNKQANLIIAEKTEDNTFEIEFYENKTGCPRPTISAYMATALAACKTGQCQYGKKIKVICKNNIVTVKCPSATEITAECEVSEIFHGSI